MDLKMEDNNIYLEKKERINSINLQAEVFEARLVDKYSSVYLYVWGL